MNQNAKHQVPYEEILHAIAMDAHAYLAEPQEISPGSPDHLNLPINAQGDRYLMPNHMDDDTDEDDWPDDAPLEDEGGWSESRTDTARVRRSDARLSSSAEIMQDLRPFVKKSRVSSHEFLLLSLGRGTCREM